MAITQTPKRSKSDAFLAGAPDAGHRAPGGAKLRGKRQPLTFSLPPELVARIDEVASEERRSRARMIEIALEDFLERRQREAA